MAGTRRLSVALLLACASADIAAIAVKPTPALQRVAVTTRPARNRLYAVAQTASPLEPSARSPVVAWGVCGFLGIIGSAIGRLTKVAIVPVLQRDLTLLQWGMFGSMMAGFAFFEGYKAFQLKFSPMLVQRAMTLSREGTPLHHIILAPFYSMGLFHATKKRRIIAWTISGGVALMVGLVKRLPYPWRSIVDAGVVSGLVWGAASIINLYVRALLGSPPGVDPCLPESK